MEACQPPHQQLSTLRLNREKRARCCFMKSFYVCLMGLLVASLIQPRFCLAQSGSLYHSPVRQASYQQAPAPGNGNANGVNNVMPPSAVLPPGASSYMAPSQPAQPSGLANSWTYIPPAQARTIRLHDIVSIRVDESATALLLGNATSRKTTSYDAVVRDWIRMVGLDTLKPAPQSDGDPRVQINENEVYRGDSTLRTSETITFNIAAQVVDILPNGLIVLEGNTTISLNDNSMEVSLIGTCRSEDIQADNTVLSRNLVNKHIKKREDGHVRDGYARGWLTRLFAKVRPF